MDNDDKHLRREGTLLTREAYDFYRKHRNHCSKGIDQYNYYLKSVEGIFNIILRMMVDSPGGVYIEGFGYLCFVRRPRKIKTRRGKAKYIKPKIEGYFPYFFPEPRFEGWNMGGAFNDYLHYLTAGNTVERTLHFDLCESYRQAKIEANRNN